METPLRRREQEVWQALDDLWSIHGNVQYLTGDAIRDRLLELGKSKGSPNEIYKYRKTWEQSRKVNIHSNNDLNIQDDDPITRAARLVHDELKLKADEQIAKITQEFKQKESDDQKEILKIKDELNNLVIEFSKLEQNYNNLKLEFKTKEEKLLSEIEIRTNLEKENIFLKQKEEALKIERENSIKALKEVHENNITELKNTYKNINEQLIAEKKQLGHEYSEDLNKIKTDNYNQKIIINRQEEKIIYIENKIELLQKEILEKNNNFSCELKRANFFLKNAETKLARLRALNKIL